MPVEFRLIKRRLQSACRKLVKKDAFLLEVNVNERTLTQRLALYLEPKFPGYSVDCEYNRNIRDIKMLPVGPVDVRSDDINAVTVFPDVIVHKRGEHEGNLLVVEAKKNLDKDLVSPCDECKLQGFTSQGGEFKYALGAFLNFNSRLADGFQITWFRNSRKLTNADVRRACKRGAGGAGND